MNTFFNRLKRVWFLLWHADAFDRFDRWDVSAAKIETILTDPAFNCVVCAVLKTAFDPSWHPTKDHEKKRRETLEWAATYCREAQLQVPSAWRINFMMEWCLGVRKGLL